MVKYVHYAEISRKLLMSNSFNYLSLNLQAPLESDLKVIDINNKHFKKWYAKNAGILQPKFWMIHLTQLADKNFDMGKKSNTWGFPEPFLSVATLKQIQNGDLLGFIGPFSPSPRIKLESYKDKNFEGRFDKMEVYKITKGYHEDYEPIWPVKPSTLKTNIGKNEYFPHRIGFDSNPIIKTNSIKVKNLSEQSREQLWALPLPPKHGLDEIKDSELLDILYNSGI